jgi:hypothetical protein
MILVQDSVQGFGSNKDVWDHRRCIPTHQHCRRSLLYQDEGDAPLVPVPVGVDVLAGNLLR